MIDRVIEVEIEEVIDRVMYADVRQCTPMSGNVRQCPAMSGDRGYAR